MMLIMDNMQTMLCLAKHTIKRIQHLNFNNTCWSMFNNTKTNKMACQSLMILLLWVLINMFHKSIVRAIKTVRGLDQFLSSLLELKTINEFISSWLPLESLLLLALAVLLTSICQQDTPTYATRYHKNLIKLLA